MEYYTKRKNHRYLGMIVIIIILIFLINFVMIIFDKRIMPTVIKIGETMARAQTLDIISEESIKILNKEFRYDKLVRIDKDNDGNIILVQSDTAKLNNISSTLAINCNEAFRDMDRARVEVPIGWMSDSSVFYNLGPTFDMELEPIGNISTSYESKFESAGINQTRHKIYLNVCAKIKMKLPFNNEDIEVKTQIPVSDTIIVGKIPNTTIGLGENSLGK